MAYRPKDRRQVLKTKLSYNNRRPEGERLSVEEVEAEVDRIMADELENGERRHLEREEKRFFAEVALYYGLRADLRERLAGCEKLSDAIGHVRRVLFDWSQDGGTFGEADRLFDELRKIGRSEEVNLELQKQYLAFTTELESRGLFASPDAAEEARDLVRGWFDASPDLTGLPHWIAANETGDFLKIMEGYPERTPADLRSWDRDAFNAIRWAKYQNPRRR